MNEVAIIGLLIGMFIGILIIHSFKKFAKKLCIKSNVDINDVKSFIMMSYISFISTLTFLLIDHIVNLPTSIADTVVCISISLTIIYGWIGIMIDHVIHKRNKETP